MAFADDLIIFLDGTEKSIAGVFTVLSQFEKLSELAVNIHKTSMFCSGISEHTEANILRRFLLKPEALPVKYLGLPLCSKRLSVKDCDPLISQIRRKYNAWMNRHLSLAGRLTLISSVIPGIIGFWTSAFCIPGKVLKLINSLSSSFLWHGCLDNPRGAKVSWENVCCPKVEGGLGLRNSASWNYGIWTQAYLVASFQSWIFMGCLGQNEISKLALILVVSAHCSQHFLDGSKACQIAPYSTIFGFL